MNPEEKRSHPRLERNESAFIRVLLGDGKSIETETEDVSSGGFKARLSHYIEPGVILHVVIEAGNPKIRFLLAGELRWCRPDEQWFLAGFELLDAQDTDYSSWQLFASL